MLLKHLVLFNFLGISCIEAVLLGEEVIEAHLHHLCIKSYSFNQLKVALLAHIFELITVGLLLLRWIFFMLAHVKKRLHLRCWGLIVGNQLTLYSLLTHFLVQAIHRYCELLQTHPHASFLTHIGQRAVISLG